MINTTINKAAADLSKTASIFYDRAIFLADSVVEGAKDESAVDEAAVVEGAVVQELKMRQL